MLGPYRAAPPDMAAVTSATLSSRATSWRASSSIPRMPSVPLIRARPSLAVSVSGSIDAAPSACPAGTRSPVAVQTSPSPTNARPQCASGARSPLAPSEPCSGTTGSSPAASRASIVSATSAARPSGPSPGAGAEEHHRARTASRSTGGPMPAACERIRQAGAPRAVPAGSRCPQRAEPRRDAVARPAGEARRSTAALRPWPRAPRPTVAPALHGGPRRRRQPARPGRRSARSLPSSSRPFDHIAGAAITAGGVPFARGDQDAKRFEPERCRWYAEQRSDPSITVQRPRSQRPVENSRPQPFGRHETRDAGGRTWWSALVLDPRGAALGRGAATLAALGSNGHGRSGRCVMPAANGRFAAAAEQLETGAPVVRWFDPPRERPELRDPRRGGPPRTHRRSLTFTGVQPPSRSPTSSRSYCRLRRSGLRWSCSGVARFSGSI